MFVNLKLAPTGESARNLKNVFEKATGEWLNINILIFFPVIRLKPSDFEFLRVLGRGSFGKVLLARRYADQHLYAVKVLEKRAVVRRNETQHIMAERNVLRNNQHHPFLVSLHASFQTREKLYFVLDYVNGGEVTRHLVKISNNELDELFIQKGVGK